MSYPYMDVYAIHAHTHTYAHTHIRTHTYICTRTHTHKYQWRLVISGSGRRVAAESGQVHNGVCVGVRAVDMVISHAIALSHLQCLHRDNI